MFVMRPGLFEQLFVSPTSGGPEVSEEKSFEILDGRRTDGWREPACTKTLRGDFDSGELKRDICG